MMSDTEMAKIPRSLLHRASTLILLLLGLTSLILACTLSFSGSFESGTFFGLLFACLSLIFIGLGMVSLHAEVGLYLSDPKAKARHRLNFRTSIILTICIAIYLVTQMLSYPYTSETLEIALSVLIAALLLMQFTHQVSTFSLLSKRHAQNKPVPATLLVSVIVFALTSLFPILFTLYVLVYVLTHFSLV